MGYSSSDSYDSGTGGNGGQTKTVLGVSVAPGQQLSVTVGAGGAGRLHTGATTNTTGSASSVGPICSANGGHVHIDTFAFNFSYEIKTGSAGGNSWYYSYVPVTGGISYSGTCGCSDGNATPTDASHSFQGYTTRYFGESNGTLYAGGGGGGYNGRGSDTSGEAGGAGGGGNGGSYISPVGGAGGANTGGGGGGSVAPPSGYGGWDGGSGGSGICIIRWGK